MLTVIEKFLFALAVVASLYFTWLGVQRIIKHISSGHGKIDWSLVWKRIGELIAKVGFFQPVFRFRLGPEHPACSDRLGLHHLPGRQSQRPGLWVHRLRNL